MKGILGRLLARDEALGARGERLARRHLRRRGYRILHRNLAVGRDEADVVALDPARTTLVIVEVKTRSSAHPPPELAIGRTKRRALSRLAARIGGRPALRGRPVRFDAIAIVWPPGGPPDLRHYTDV